MQKQYLPLLGVLVGGALVFAVLMSLEGPSVPAPIADQPTGVAEPAAAVPTAPKAAAEVVSTAAPVVAAAVAPVGSPPAAIPAANTAQQKGEIGLFFTSNTLGELIDCGCRQNPLGGLARRVQWINDRRAKFDAALVVDTGGMLVADPVGWSEDATQLEARAELYFAAFEANAAAGVNVGAHELALPAKTLQAIAKRHNVALLSANLRAGDAPAFTESRIVTLAGQKFGLFGLVTADIPNADKLLKAHGLHVEAPLAAAKRVAAELRKQGATMVIALGQLRQEEIDDLGEKVPDVDLVLGSWEMDLTQRPISLGRGFHLDPYNKGKWIGEVRVRPAMAAATTTQWYAPDLRDKLSYEQGSLQRQIAYYIEQFAKEDAAGATKTMTADERKFATERQVMLRAKLARVNLELKGDIDPPNGAGALLVQMTAVRVELPEDLGVKALVDKHHARWPPPAVQH